HAFRTFPIPLDVGYRGQYPLEVAFEFSSSKWKKVIDNLKNSADGMSRLNAGLKAAAKRGQYKLVRALIEEGVSLDGVLDGADWKDAEINGKSFLIRAIKKQDRKMIEVCLQNGVKLDAKDSEGNTPLHLAVLEGDEKTALQLVQHPELLNVANDKGQTPLGLAVLKRKADLIKLLSSKGAKLKPVAAVA